MLHKSQFNNPLIQWIDTRLPIFTFIQNEYGKFQVPRNINYLWAFGAIATLSLAVLFVTGILLSMHYIANTAMAFASVDHIMRDVNYGWLLRDLHANFSSFFFAAIYIHMARSIYYGSHKNPRELLWIIGVLIFVLMIATGFLGYVLPWGQMSFWAATVITNLFSAFPGIGDSIVTWLLGGFSVDNPTLNRFYSLHFLLPFLLLAVLGLHINALHVVGCNNPTGLEPQMPQDTVSFHPYITVKDLLACCLFLIVVSVFVFFAPTYWGHPDNFIPANPLVTPSHIVPEWYYLWLYAILRAIPDKLGGTVAMFGAVLVLFVVPWLDTAKVRSLTFRPTARFFFWLLIIDITVLSFCGARSPEGVWVLLARIGTGYYFTYFLIIMPLIGLFERARLVPASLSEALSLKKAVRGAVLLLAAGGLMLSLAGHAWADPELPAHVWHQSGPFGTIDPQQAQRGFQVYKEVCSGCHALKLVPFRTLQGIGFTEDQVKTIAAQWPYLVDDEPNDEGKILKRAPRPYDRMIGPFANEKEAQATMGGSLPPDLSLIVKARHGGEDYLTAVLTGYQNPPPDGFKLIEGRYYNRYFPGHQISMPQMLQDDSVTYADGTKATVEQEAEDVATFLSFVADPTQDQRKHLGIRVIVFLLLFSGLMYLCKRVIWRDAH